MTFTLPNSPKLSSTIILHHMVNQEIFRPRKFEAICYSTFGFICYTSNCMIWINTLKMLVQKMSNALLLFHTVLYTVLCLPNGKLRVKILIERALSGQH